MRARLWLPLGLFLALPFAPTTVLAHGKNDANRNHPGRVNATTGNFRRAAVLKVTESRVCQLHSQCVARLRVKLRAW